jgi:predicted nucleotidyltransferase component of viral defense system
MKLSRERLLREAGVTGFRPESLEKVIRLIGLLNGIFKQPYMQGRLALKGGTALNLFLFDVPPAFPWMST